MKFEITVKNTSIEVNHGAEAIKKLSPLVNMLTYEDEFVEETKTLGIMLDRRHDILFINKGIDAEFVRRLLENTSIKYDMSYEGENMTYQFEELIAPRNDKQVDIINFIAGTDIHETNLNNSQLFVVAAPGFGKTYCTGYGIGLYGKKALIIMHRDNLREQWNDSLFTMNGFEHRHVHEIDNAEELQLIAEGKLVLDYDIYLMTHATFRAGLSRINDIITSMNIVKNLGIGIKVIDEAHLEFRNIIFIDMILNVKRNIYLTATFGRSQRDENAIYKHIFSNCLFYKERENVSVNTPSRWVEYVCIQLNSHCNKNIYRYRVTAGRGMTPASYGRWVIQYDKKRTHFKCTKDIVTECFDRDENAKILILIPLITLCESLADYLIEELDRDKRFKYSLTIKTITSNNSKSENSQNKKADIIVSTIGSMGTGSDVSGLTDIISMTPFCSKITAEQTFGRIRYNGKKGHYYDIIDESVMIDKIWWRSRSKFFKTKALRFNTLYWSEE